MSKETLRQKTLSFTEEDLNACKKGVLSSSLIKKLQQRFLTLIIVGVFLSFFFLGLFCFILLNKTIVTMQFGQFYEIIYYVLMGTILLLNACFFYVIITNLKKHKEAKRELISVVKVSLNEIKYCITKNRSIAPYLEVKSLQFGPILPLKNITEIFDSGISYLFYYSSKSKTLLAVAEQRKTL